MPEPSGVLVTRPEPAASRTAQHLKDLGFTPIPAPLLRIRPLEHRLPDPALLQAILVTSANALPGLPSTYRHLPLYAVGDGTAARARALSFCIVVSAGADAAALASLARAALRPEAGPLLLAAGTGRSAALAASLRATGFAVLRRTLYEARPVACLPAAAANALTKKGLAAALFFSAETAHTFARLVIKAGLAPALGSVTALAIGESAAAVLRPLPFRCVRVALRPTEEALLAMLA